MNPLRALFIIISRIPPGLILTAIVGIAACVAVAVNNCISSIKQGAADQTLAMESKLHEKGKVVYALKDVPEGQVLSSDILEERPVEIYKIPPDALSSASLVSGRIAKYGISANSIISTHDLAPQGVSVGFDSLLKEGMRAITFAVDSNTGVAGFVIPQSRVDIIGMVGSGPETRTAPILSDVQVIAVGQTFQKAQSGGGAIPASCVTVAVTPADGGKLLKALSAGKLYLALRNERDHTPVATVDVISLFGAKSKISAESFQPLQAMTPPPPPSADLISGPNAKSELSLATPPLAIKHEIEQWSASKRDVVAFPLNSTN